MAPETETAKDQDPHPSNIRTPSEEDIENLFMYHAPTEEQIPKYKAINDAAKAYAQVILANAPVCADRTSAFRKLRDSRMWANAAVALEPQG